MKRGQLLGMPLVLIFALIVGAMILAWGVYTVMDLIGEADYVELLDTIDNLENNIDAYGNYDKGSAKVYVLDFPAGVESVCFYNSPGTGDCLLDGASCPEELQDDLSLMLEQSYNIYIYPLGEFERSRFMIEDFYPEGSNPECISNGNNALITKQDDFVSVTYYEG